MLGFASVKELIEVLLVPVSLALLAIGWPALAARRRRVNFESLTRRELQEAAPSGLDSVGGPWHSYLAKRFLHEEFIRSAVDNADFVLSLEPDLSYHLSQLWIAFYKAEAEWKAGKGPTPDHANQFVLHLGEVADYLDRACKSRLREVVWKPWDQLIRKLFPVAPQ
jgi:hypothetical protein